MQERDAMTCRACGNEERASEGYPCVDCGTFVCSICDLRGVTRCATCEAVRVALEGTAGSSADAVPPATSAS